MTIEFLTPMSAYYAPSILGLKACPRCKKTRLLFRFWKEKKWCKNCQVCREGNFSPTIQATRKRWLATMEGNKKQRASASKYMRKYRRTPEGAEADRRNNRIYDKRHPDRKQAHRAVHDAIKSGRLVRQPCQVCGATAEAHHPDYSKPLEVSWLCGEHHREAHGIVTDSSQVPRN